MRRCAADVSSKPRATAQDRIAIADLVGEADVVPELPVGVALRTDLLDIAPECVRLGDLVNGLLDPLAGVVRLINNTDEERLSLPPRPQPNSSIRPVRLYLRTGVRLREVITLRDRK